MKNKVQNIIKMYSQISNYNNMIFEKENDILSCIKAIGEEGIELRQKNAAASLCELKDKKDSLISELNTLLKSLDNDSFVNKKASNGLLLKCIYGNVSGENYRILKQIYQNN